MPELLSFTLQLPTNSCQQEIHVECISMARNTRSGGREQRAGPVEGTQHSLCSQAHGETSLNAGLQPSI